MADTTEQLAARLGRKFNVGEIVFTEGSTGKEMYVIQSGKVRITKRIRDVEKELTVIGAGEFFGEMALLNNKPRTATATVIEEGQLLVISPTTFEAMVKGNTEIGVRLIKRLAQRLDEADRQIENLLLKDNTSRVVHFLAYTAENTGEAAPEGVLIKFNAATIASRLGINEHDANSILDKLVKARLAQYVPQGLIIGNVNMLRKYLEFLEMKEKFGE
ncbi:MAG: hypothetical protein Kow0090_21060 [Myxococcota bacterium]